LLEEETTIISSYSETLTVVSITLVDFLAGAGIKKGEAGFLLDKSIFKGVEGSSLL
jgi:hypothetical protein